MFVVMVILGFILNLIFRALADSRLDAAMLLGAVLCAAGAVLYCLSFSGKQSS